MDLNELGLTAAGIEAARRVLGGSLDVVGEALESWTRLKLHNVGEVIENAGTKVGDNPDGQVPARAAMQVFEDSAFASDEMLVEYFGGVLASGHALVPRDDRAASWSALVRSMSAYEIRVHYILYRGVRQACEGTLVNWGQLAEADKHRVFVTRRELVAAMEFSDAEKSDVDLLGEALYGLRRRDLVHDFADGSPSSLKGGGAGSWFPESGVVFTPSAPGVSLFLWAHGRGRELHMRISDPELTLAFSTEIPQARGRLTSSLRP